MLKGNWVNYIDKDGKKLKATLEDTPTGSENITIKLPNGKIIKKVRKMTSKIVTNCYNRHLVVDLSKVRPKQSQKPKSIS